jgi:hypothetical protein
MPTIGGGIRQDDEKQTGYMYGYWILELSLTDVVVHIHPMYINMVGT